MCVLGSGQTQCSLQGDLARSAAQKVGATYDMRDFLGGIVDDDRQLICKQTVAPADDEVTRIKGKLRGLQSLQPVHERNRAGCYQKTDRRRTVRSPHAVATPTKVEQLVGRVAAGRLRCLQLSSTARAGESAASAEQLVERRSLECVTLALSADRPGPLEAERRECRDDLVGAAGHFARGIEIFDSQQPVAADAARLEITCSRCYERAEVQRPGGRGRETPAICSARGRPDLI